jgi:hypothetical protein
VAHPTDVPRAFSEIREQLAQVVSRIQETSDQESRLELLKEMLALLGGSGPNSQHDGYYRKVI